MPLIAGTCNRSKQQVVLHADKLRDHWSYSTLQDRSWAMPRPGHEACSWCGQLLKRSGCRWKGGPRAIASPALLKTWTGRSFSSIGTGDRARDGPNPHLAECPRLLDC